MLHVSDRFVVGGKRDTVHERDGTARRVTVRGGRAQRGDGAEGASEGVFRRHPTLLPELLRRCDGLAKGLDVVRVDYLLARGATGGAGAGGREHGRERERGYELLLGEITPYPGGGAFHWDPPEFDLELGLAYHGASPRPARAGRPLGAPSKE